MSDLESLTFTIHDEVPEDGRLVDEGLGRFNDEAAPLRDVQPLSCFARLASGEEVGGVIRGFPGEIVKHVMIHRFA